MGYMQSGVVWEVVLKHPICLKAQLQSDYVPVGRRFSKNLPTPPPNLCSLHLF